LHEIVANLGSSKDPRLLVGFDHADDAAVYLLRDDLAVIQTADFITPIVDDPFRFGRVAAVNSLSDVYAMGGKPVTALNLCCFPCSGLEKSDLRAILEGGLEKITEAGASLAGGHTVRDTELKYGLSVLGTVHPKDLKPNSGAKPGDAIFLTKKLGTGVLTTAGKKGLISEEALEEAIRSMETLNEKACARMVEFGAHAATDITGFGLAVHLLEVAEASQVSLEVSAGALPVFPKALELLGQGIKPGITLQNEQASVGKIEFAPSVSREMQLLCFDPQTSGGLAIFIAEKKTTQLLRALQDDGVEAARIGTVGGGSPRLNVCD